MSTDDLARPRRARVAGLVRRRWRVIALLLIVVLVYVAVVVSYALGGRVTTVGEQPEPEPGGVTVLLSPQTVNPATETMTTQLGLQASPELTTEDGVSLKDPITLLISPIAGDQTIEFAQGAVPGIKSATIFASGDVEDWPFDTYDVDLKILAYTTVDGVRQALKTYVYADGNVPGWSLSASNVTAAQPGDSASLGEVTISAARSSSTLAFGFLLLALMIVMVSLVLFVATTVYRGRRKVEASFMSWMAAMLFATIPLRSFLPGSPPIGSWIDFTVVLWVIVGLISGLAIYVAGWYRWGSSNLPKDAKK